MTVFIIYQIMAIVGASVLSYQTSQMMCKVAAISLAPYHKLSKYKILTFFSLILLFLCPVVICLGHFLSASSQLPQYSLNLKFVNIFLPWIFFWFWMICIPFSYMFLLPLSWINHLKIIINEKPSSQTNLKLWTRKVIFLYHELEDHMKQYNFWILSLLQISWIFELFLAITFPAMNHTSLDTISILFISTGYLFFALFNFLCLAVYIFNADDLFLKMKDLKRWIKRILNEDDFEAMCLYEDLADVQPLSGLGLFQIRRSNLTSMVSIAITYLIILVQFRLTMVN